MANEKNNILQLNFTDVSEMQNTDKPEISMINTEEENFNARIAQSIELSNHVYQQINEFVMDGHNDMTVAEVLFGVAFTIFSSLSIMYPPSQDMTDRDRELIVKEVMNVIKDNDIYAEDALKVLSTTLMNYLIFLAHKDLENDTGDF